MTLGNDIIINLGKRIITAQQALQQCTWLEVIYGRAWKAYSKIEGKTQHFIYPEVYISNKEYKNMMPNDKLRAFCFFVPKDPARYENYMPNVNNECYQNVDIIFWFNYKLINQFIDAPFADAVYHDVKEALKHLSFLRIEAVYYEPNEVYKGFSISEVDTQYLTFPFGGFRLQCRFSFLDDCQPFFFDDFVTPPLVTAGKLIGIDNVFNINSNNPLSNSTLTQFKNFIIANKLDYEKLKTTLKEGANVTIAFDDTNRTATITSTGGGGVTIHGNLSGLDADNQHPLWKTINASTVPVGIATADDRIMFWTATGWIYNKLSEFLQGLAGALAWVFAPFSHGDDNHSETYIKEGDTRLTDARTPLEHGNEAHSVAYITGSDVPANESDPVFSNSEAANFVTGDKTKLDTALQAVTVDGVTITGDGTAGNPLVATAQPANESTVTLVNDYTGNLAGATTQEGVNQVVDALPNQSDYDYLYWQHKSLI